MGRLDFMDDMTANRTADTPEEATPEAAAKATAKPATDSTADPIAQAPAEPVADAPTEPTEGAAPAKPLPAAEPTATPPVADDTPAGSTSPAAFFPSADTSVPPAGHLPPAGTPVLPTASTAARRPTRLVRSRSNRMVAGVCGGLAELLNIDAVILRLALVLATVLGFGAGVVLYVACWILMPKEPERASGVAS